MTVKEMKERFAGQYADVEVYVFNSKKHSVHTDFVNLTEDFSDDSEIDIVFSELMDKETYSNSILANSSVSWEDYGMEEEDKILVLVLEK